MRLFHWPILMLALALSACASVTPYQPLHEGYGYSAQRIENNRFRISFAGSSKTPRQTVENYAMYQCAEVTLAGGNDYFVVSGGGTQASGGREPSVSFGLGGFGFGGHTGMGVGVATQTGGDPSLAYTAVYEIVTGQGPKPPDPQAYDARQVKANLEALIVRPEAR